MASRSDLDLVLAECKTILAQCLIAANDAATAVQQISDEGLAPLNSPLFVGDPRGPTPLPSDASNSLATTAWMAEKFGQAGGVATLDVNGLVPIAQLPFTTLTFDGVWNAQTNSPTLSSSSGTAGHYFIVSVSGSTTLNGISSWSVGDQAVFSGSVWQRVPFVAPPLSNVPLTSLAGQANNTFVGNVSGTSASPSAIPVSSLMSLLSVMIGATGSTGGAVGFVPAPPLGGSGLVLFGNATWGSVGSPNLSAYATLLSPAFTGTATVSTQARGSFSSAIASTAFVINQLAQATEASQLQMNGTLSAGTSTYGAAIDHIHPTDLSRAAATAAIINGLTVSGTLSLLSLAALTGTAVGGTLTLNGTVTLGGLATGITRSANDNSTKLATTAYVDGLAITESKLSLSDVTTANATTSQHGLLPKLSGTATQFLTGTGGWAVPASSLAGTGGVKVVGGTASLDTNNSAGIGASALIAQTTGTTLNNGDTFTANGTGNSQFIGFDMGTGNPTNVGTVPNGQVWRNVSGGTIGSGVAGLFIRVS